jgi:hypothetical protein
MWLKNLADALDNHVDEGLLGLNAFALGSPFDVDRMSGRPVRPRGQKIIVVAGLTARSGALWTATACHSAAPA